MANNEQMTVSDVIQFLKEQAYKWRVREKFHARQANYVEAKSYADMEYAARVLAVEIENKLYKRMMEHDGKYTSESK